MVLAAGAGARFGGGKLLADWHGRPLIAATVGIALNLPVSEVVVVVGYASRRLEEALAPITESRLRTVVAKDWQSGLSASLKVGVRALPGDSAGFVLFLGDMPLVPMVLAQEVLEALIRDCRPVQPWYHDVPAHPVGLPAAYYPQLLTLEGDAGAARLLQDDIEVVRLQADSAGSVFDVDRPSDLVNTGQRT